VVADGRLIHDSGGSEVQELAFVLATGVAYLRALEGAGSRSRTPATWSMRGSAPMPTNS
jgi:methylmalonyl-CoA mutase N-terminal domain/subunit